MAVFSVAEACEALLPSRGRGTSSPVGTQPPRGGVALPGGVVWWRPDSNDEPPDSPEPAASTPSASDGPSIRKVLLVDDEPDVLRTTADLLRILGYDVTCADSGPEALRLLQATPGIGLLVSDVRMPGMSGVTLAHEAQRIAPALKVVLVSGYATADLTARDVLNFPLLAKPFRMADLERLLHGG